LGVWQKNDQNGPKDDVKNNVKNGYHECSDCSVGISFCLVVAVCVILELHPFPPHEQLLAAVVLGWWLCWSSLWFLGSGVIREQNKTYH
jgi:hypothetical protein